MAADSAKPKKGTACPKCGNRLRVRPDQKGEQVRCPKCNAEFTVGSRPKPAAAPASADAQYEPEIPLKKSTIVPQEPAMLPASGAAPTITHEEPGQLDLGEEAPVVEPMRAPEMSYVPQTADDASGDELARERPTARPPRDQPDYLTMAKERGLLRDDESQTIPKWTFFSGVFSYPWYLQNVARWASMSLGLTATSFLAAFALAGIVGELSLASVAMPLLMMGLAGMALATFAFCAACFLSTVDDTSDGHDDPQEGAFPPLDQWIFSFFSVLGIWLMSGALGYPVTLVPVVGPVAILVSSLVLFPILLLSAMECDSFFVPWSPNVWRTLVGFPGAWLTFYLLSTALLAGWFVLSVLGLAAVGGAAFLLAGPALAAVMLIYGRLLGRLAWRITHVDSRAPRQRPQSQEQTQPAVPRRGSKKRKKVRKLKLDLPDDLDRRSGEPRDRGPEPRTRLDFHKRG